MTTRPPSRGGNGHAGRGPGRGRARGTSPWVGAGGGSGGGGKRDSCPLMMLLLPLWPIFVAVHALRSWWAWRDGR